MMMNCEYKLIKQYDEASIEKMINEAAHDDWRIVTFQAIPWPHLYYVALMKRDF